VPSQVEVEVGTKSIRYGQPGAVQLPSQGLVRCQFLAIPRVMHSLAVECRLHRIVVERRYAGSAQITGGEPTRNITVAQNKRVGQHLRDAGACRGARCLVCVADEHDAIQQKIVQRHDVVGAHAQVGGGELMQLLRAGHGGSQGPVAIVPELPEPWVVGRMEAEIFARKQS
jgi:hypothetical protein